MKYLFFAVLLFASAAAAQKPVKIIVPLAAGGTGDTLARLLAEELSRTLGSAVIVTGRGATRA